MNTLSLAARAGRHLDLAIGMWLLGVFGSAAVGLVLSEAGVAEGLVIGLALVVNLGVAWHLAKAAQAQGRRPWLWGLIAALCPATSMGVWSFLNFSR